MFHFLCSPLCMYKCRSRQYRHMQHFHHRDWGLPNIRLHLKRKVGVAENFILHQTILVDQIYNHFCVGINENHLTTQAKHNTHKRTRDHFKITAMVFFILYSNSKVPCDHSLCLGKKWHMLVSLPTPLYK